MPVLPEQPRWLMLAFSLPANRASERVEIWRKLRRVGALAMASSGRLLPVTPANREKFEWLAASIRRYKGQASVIQVHSIDELPDEDLARRFVDVRSRDYALLIAELNKIKRASGTTELTRLRRRFQEIVSIDFFNSPMRSRAESLMARITDPATPPARSVGRHAKKFQKRIWVTRPRPGIDRVSSAWLIEKFIDPAAKFAYANDPKSTSGSIPFDMFHADGFGHRGDDCTFETLRKEFAIRDPKVVTVGEIVHDADLDDGKFGRSEGLGLDRVLIGWAQQGVPDEELLRRGMQLIDGLYHSMI
jgi:hypothetical protein